MITKRFAPLSFLAAAVASMAGRFWGFLPAVIPSPVPQARTAAPVAVTPADVRQRLDAAALLKAELKRLRKGTARNASAYSRTNPQFFAASNPLAD